MANARTFKTTKGTELPILDLRGKEYLEVKYRLVWFREDHPDWSIETELIEIGPDHAIAKATIRDDKGRIITTSHKHENKTGFADYHEKAESGSIGRALALLGYGTQFCADELDEGKRIVDSPTDKRPPPKPSGKQAAPQQSAKVVPLNKYPNTPDTFKDEDYGAFECSFGKHKGKKLRDFGEHDLDKFVEWLKKQPNLSTSAEVFISKAEAYLTSREFPDPRMKRSDEIPY